MGTGDEDHRDQRGYHGLEQDVESLASEGGLVISSWWIMRGCILVPLYQRGVWVTSPNSPPNATSSLATAASVFYGHRLTYVL